MEGVIPEFITVTDGEESTHILNLVAEPDVYDYSITIVDRETGKGIEGAEVSGVGDHNPSGGNLMMYGESSSFGSSRLLTS